MNGDSGFNAVHKRFLPDQDAHRDPREPHTLVVSMSTHNPLHLVLGARNSPYVTADITFSKKFIYNPVAS